jgi:dihydroxyacetone kinase-like protein
MPADAIVDEMLNKIIEDLPYQNGDEVAILVNGLGATPLEEQYVMFRRIHQVLSEKGINIFSIRILANMQHRWKWRALRSLC